MQSTLSEATHYYGANAVASFVQFGEIVVATTTVS